MSNLKDLLFEVTFLLLLIHIDIAKGCHSIDDYGGVPNDPSNKASWINTKALFSAIVAANDSVSDKTVYIPPSKEYFIFNVELTQIFDVTIKIDGYLKASNNITEWPKRVFYTHGVLMLVGCKNITLNGNGVFDGQGYDWWWYTILFHKEERPHLVIIEKCEGLLIENLLFKNSPQFHLRLSDVKDVIVRNVTIKVDVTKQMEMLSSKGLTMKTDGKQGFSIPTFPLNTDGIDPSGINVLIENCTIENFDDAVAVKPMNGGGYYSTCSSNITIRNTKVKYGVGMTIGSVPPNSRVNCVKGVLFENITFETPIKGIYIKTNPGDHGTGIIDSITYRNIFMDGALWYPVWIGPQQQQQPGTKGTGCSFLYPIVKECPTQPRVPITRVTLENITMVNGLTLPGVILCNETKPCSDFVFKNVQNSGSFLVQKSYVCENVNGVHDNTKPEPGCF